MSYGLFGESGTTSSSAVADTMRIVVAVEARRVLAIVLRDEGEERARQLDEVLFVGGDEMRDAAARRVGRRAAELFERHLLARDRLDDLGAGDEHLRDLFGHEDEVGDRRRVDGAAGARPGDQADLRDHAAGLNVAPEDLGVPAERYDALLNARAAGVVDADQRRAGAHRQVHHLADLLGERFAERSAEHREILREEEDLAAVERGASGDDAVAEKLFFVQSERVGPMDDETVELDERTLVDEAPRRARARSVCRARAAFRRPRARRGMPLVRSLRAARRTFRRGSSRAHLARRFGIVILSGATVKGHGEPRQNTAPCCVAFFRFCLRPRTAASTENRRACRAWFRCAVGCLRCVRVARALRRPERLSDAAARPADASGRRDQVRHVGHRSVPVLRKHEGPGRRQLLQGAERIRAGGARAGSAPRGSSSSIASSCSTTRAPAFQA